MSQFSTTKTFIVIENQAELVLKLFLNFVKFELRCSYKVVIIKKACNERKLRRRASSERRVDTESFYTF